VQLAGGALRDLVHEEDLLRHLVVGCPRADEGLQLAIAGLLPLAQHDDRGDLFAELRCGMPKHTTCATGRVVHQDLVDLARADLLAAAVDDFLERPVRLR
jgi:hypothetical protein